MLVYQAEATELNPERKLVISVYCEKQLNLERVSVEGYPEGNFDTLDWALYEAVQAQSDSFNDDI